MTLSAARPRSEPNPSLYLVQVLLSDSPRVNVDPNGARIANCTHNLKIPSRPGWGEKTSSARFLGQANGKSVMPNCGRARDSQFRNSRPIRASKSVRPCWEIPVNGPRHEADMILKGSSLISCSVNTGRGESLRLLRSIESDEGRSRLRPTTRGFAPNGNCARAQLNLLPRRAMTRRNI